MNRKVLSEDEVYGGDESVWVHEERQTVCKWEVRR